MCRADNVIQYEDGFRWQELSSPLSGALQLVVSPR